MQCRGTPKRGNVVWVFIPAPQGADSPAKTQPAETCHQYFSTTTGMKCGTYLIVMQVSGRDPRPGRERAKKKKRDRKTKTDPSSPLPSSPLPSSPLPSSPLLCLLSTFLLLLFVCFSHNSRIKVPCQHQQFPAGLFRADLVWEGEKLVQALWD